VARISSRHRARSVNDPTLSNEMNSSSNRVTVRRCHRAAARCVNIRRAGRSRAAASMASTRLRRHRQPHHVLTTRQHLTTALTVALGHRPQPTCRRTTAPAFDTIANHQKPV
jgi:hypothetical protein